MGRYGNTACTKNQSRNHQFCLISQQVMIGFAATGVEAVAMSRVAIDTTPDRQLLDQVEHILESETLQNSETLKRLLRFLAEKTSQGQGDQLKEYTIAVDAMDRPATYDPRHDSAVRIQVGRLRQKLAEYYRTEGKHDPVIIDLPKGHFKLRCEPRDMEKDSIRVQPQPASVRAFAWAGTAVFALLMVAIGWSASSFFSIRRTEAMSSVGEGRWTSDLQQLWQPLLAGGRPMLLAIEDPLFVELQRGSGIYYRDKSFDEWGQAFGSRGVQALRKTFDFPNTQPSRYYTSFGEVNAAFQIGRLLGVRVPNVSIVRTSELSWDQLARNNVVFVGVPVFFGEQFKTMPVQPKFVLVSDGIRNVDPKAGEPSIFLDRFSTAPTEAGEIYALVTRSPGPVGSTYFESFMSNRAAGYVGAVRWFTDPNFSNALVSHLKKEYGSVPNYFQVVLRVEFTDQVATQTSYVASRQLP
jgi:hypothetical protein